jgi:cytochrome d ubiquinol oxidase subunit II
MAWLQIVWFALIAVLLGGYAVLDGFDLGVGALYPFLGKTEEEKAVMRDSVGPVWDGNEVWLLTGGGALFAAFPPVYATVFSGFYLALMLVLFALIFRAVSFEFRAMDPAWGKVWDWSFFLGSALPALLFGVAAGNIIRGVTLVKVGGALEFAPGGGLNGLLFLLNPYSLLVGVVGLTYFVAHGASWLVRKSWGDLQARAKKVRFWGYAALTVLLVVLALATVFALPGRALGIYGSWYGWVGIVLTWAGIGLAWFSISRDWDMGAFYGGAATILGLVATWAAAIFPNLVPRLSGIGGLSVFNSSSSDYTLTVMLIIALIGVPIMLAYTGIVYGKFAGKVVLDSEGY